LIILPQEAIDSEKIQHRGVVVWGELLIERAFLHTFGQQFGNMAASVVDGLTLADGFAVEDVVVLQQGAAGGIYFDFEFHSQLAAITQHGFVDGRQTRGTAVEVVAFVEGAVLRGSVSEDELRSAAQSPVTATGTLARFKNSAVESGSAQFVGGDQSGDTGAENDDFGPAAGGRRQGEIFLLFSFDHTQKAEGVHRHESCTEAAGVGYFGDEIASGEGHGVVVAFFVAGVRFLLWLASFIVSALAISQMSNRVSPLSIFDLGPGIFFKIEVRYHGLLGRGRT